VDGECVDHFEGILDWRRIQSYIGVQLREITKNLSIGIGVEDFAKDRRSLSLEGHFIAPVWLAK
jgi:hypothetical protein